MHPLELTDFLQGLDVGTPADPHYESWDSMIPDWESFVEWSVANYQNEIEFVLFFFLIEFFFFPQTINYYFF